MAKVTTVLLLFLVFSFLLAGEAVKVFPFVDTEIDDPVWLAVDAERIYVPGLHSVKFFSRENFKLEKTIGKKGEGPGEFKTTPFIHIHPGGFVLSTGDKVSFYSRAGKLLKEIPVNVRGGFLKPLGKGYLGYKLKLEPDEFYLAYVLFDANMKEKKELSRGKWIMHKNRKRDLFETFFFEVYEDKIVFAHYGPGFAIDILNAEGGKLHTIRRKDKPIPFTAKDKQAVLDYWRRHPSYRSSFDFFKKVTVFPGHYPAIRACRLANGKIYVITYVMEKGKSECLIYSMTGKFLKRIFIPLYIDAPNALSPFAIYGGELFQLYDNIEKESWELHIHRIE